MPRLSPPPSSFGGFSPRSYDLGLFFKFFPQESTLIGCLLPVLLLAVGGIIGAVIGGPDWAIWGGGAGFLVGTVVMAIFVWIVARARKK